MKNKMTTFTVAIPDELKKRLEGLPEVNWAEYLKKQFEAKMQQLRKFEELASNGKV